MMNDRIQRALDGELPVAQLSPEEAEAYLRCKAALGAALRPIERMEAIDVSADVLRRIAGLERPERSRPEPGRLRRALDAATRWLWSPRPVSLTVRPAFAMAGVLAVAALVWVAARTAAPAAPHPTATAATATATATPAAPARVLVQFRLGAAGAHDVALVGDFNAWRPEHRLHQIAAGVWSVDVALEPGVYNYGFMIDGTIWRLDPLAPQITDGFGGASSRVTVLAPETRS